MKLRNVLYGVLGALVLVLGWMLCTPEDAAAAVLEPAKVEPSMVFVPMACGAELDAKMAALFDPSVAFGDNCGDIAIDVVPEGDGFRVYIDIPQTLSYYVFLNDGGGCGPQAFSGCDSWVVTTCEDFRGGMQELHVDSDFFYPNPGSGNEVHVQCHGYQWSSPVAVIEGY